MDISLWRRYCQFVTIAALGPEAATHPPAKVAALPVEQIGAPPRFGVC